MKQEADSKTYLCFKQDNNKATKYRNCCENKTLKEIRNLKLN